MEDICNIDWLINNNVRSKYLIKARSNTSAEFLAVDMKDENNIDIEIETAMLQ